MEVLGWPRVEGTRFVGEAECNLDITDRKQAEEERNNSLGNGQPQRQRKRQITSKMNFWQSFLTSGDRLLIQFWAGRNC
jgi:hypothetical protein